jgi:hypothetical protein
MAYNASSPIYKLRGSSVVFRIRISDRGSNNFDTPLYMSLDCIVIHVLQSTSLVLTVQRVLYNVHVYINCENNK